jgi:hypothetical protein
MIGLEGQPGELRFTLEITRAATGETETVELIGKIGDTNGSNTLNSGPECSD